MAETHWKKLRNPDYLGAYAINPGEEPIFTIKAVKNEVVTSTEGKKETCTIVYFAEPGVKPMILNATNGKAIEKALGTPLIEKWVGKRIQLYVETGVKAFGEVVDALRVRKTAPATVGQIHICKDCNNTVTESSGWSADKIASFSKKKHNRVLCAACLRKADAPTADEAKAEEAPVENSQPEVTNEVTDAT